VESINSVGINLAWLVNVRMGEHFDLRLASPRSDIFRRRLVYSQQYTDPSSVEKKVQSITLSFPFQIAFSSDRIGNFKAYTIAGGNFTYDLASNAKARKAEDLIKLKPYNFIAEVGIGCHIYFSYFVLSPELKLSDG